MVDFVRENHLGTAAHPLTHAHTRTHTHPHTSPLFYSGRMRAFSLALAAAHTRAQATSAQATSAQATSAWQLRLRTRIAAVAELS
jgi:hypothetical protein